MKAVWSQLARKGYGPLLAALSSMAWCATYVWPLVDPFSLEIVFHDDWAQHVLGWFFFRSERVTFPLGRLRKFLYPLGTTLGFMDSIPCVAFLLRPFSKLLPVDFQYLGLWILVCSGVLGGIAAVLWRRLTPHWEQQALAGLLVAMSPTLVERIGHPALCAHALIVAALAMNVIAIESAAAARRICLSAIAVSCVSALTHVYLALMVVALALGIPWKARSKLGAWPIAASAVAILIGPLAIFAALGYFSDRAEGAIGGFGNFSANLNTFINSRGHSRIFPELPIGPQQYEGGAYLGAGVLLFVAMSVGCSLVPVTRRRVLALPWARAGWVLFVSTGCAIYSFATPWRWGGVELFHIDAYENLSSLTQILRSSGRFIWPLLYCIVCASIAVSIAVLRSSRLALTSLLTVAVGLQAYDIDTSSAWPRPKSPPVRFYRAPEWSLAKVRHLILYPAEIYTACDGPRGFRTNDVAALGYLAYQHRWTFNSGYTARVARGTKESCEALRADIERGQLKQDALYLVWPDDLAKFRAAGSTCGMIDELYACVRPNTDDDAFAAYLRDHPEPPRPRKHRKAH